MYLRTTSRKNRDGRVVEYHQLAHNESALVTRKPVARVIHNFGRADKADRDELIRLCKSIARVCKVDFIDRLAKVSLSGLVDFPSRSYCPSNLSL